MILVEKLWPNFAWFFVQEMSGSEAAIHAMHNVDADDSDAVLLTDAVLLIDASNAYNALNRATA